MAGRGEDGSGCRKDVGGSVVVGCGCDVAAGGYGEDRSGCGVDVSRCTDGVTGECGDDSDCCSGGAFMPGWWKKTMSGECGVEVAGAFGDTEFPEEDVDQVDGERRG